MCSNFDFLWDLCSRDHLSTESDSNKTHRKVKKSVKPSCETSKRAREIDEKTKQLGNSLTEIKPFQNQPTSKKKLKAESLKHLPYDNVLRELSEIATKKKGEPVNLKREREKNTNEEEPSVMQASPLLKQPAVQKKSKTNRLPRELRKFTQQELNITESMKDLMSQLMKEIEKPGQSEHSNYLKLPIISEDNLTAMKKNIEEVGQEGLPSFLELVEVEGMGNGIFLRSDAQEIAPGTVFGEYLGKLIVITDDDYSKRTPEKVAYAYDLHGPFELERNEFTSLKKDGYISSKVKWKSGADFWITVDARSQGNWTRFVNGADIAKNSNVEAVVTKIEDGSKHYFTVVLKALVRIKPGQQLLLNYGPQYWRTMGINPRKVTPNTYRLE